MMRSWVPLELLCDGITFVQCFFANYPLMGTKRCALLETTTISDSKISIHTNEIISTHTPTHTMMRIMHRAEYKCNAVYCHKVVHITYIEVPIFFPINH